jgi:heavy metal sensor kinase
MKFRPPLPLRSFRLRIALFSVLVSGVVLAVFVSLTLEAVHRITERRMDAQIKEFAHKHLVGLRGPGHWERVSDSLQFFLGDNTDDAFILLVKDRDGNMLYQSPNWPREIPTDLFPAPDAWGRRSEAARDASRPRRPREPRSAQDNPPAKTPPLKTPQLKTPELFTREANGIKWRIGMTGSPELTFVLGLNTRRITEEMAQIRHAVLMALPIALLFVAAGAWWISQRALKPIEAVTGTIREVKTKGLSQRVSDQKEDREFSELIALFNDMMDWLENSFRQAVRFSADASHELKTPLTVLQAQLEQAVHEAEPGSQEQRRYVAFGKELQRLKSITQKLLLLSRIDAGELKFHLRPLDLSQMIEGIAEDTEILAPELRIESEIAPGLQVMGDADLMKQVVQNLAANAVKYNCKGGFIRMALHADGERVRLSMANSGRGIPPEERGRVFTRFYRGDKARSRTVSGAGLGLSIAREIVRAHQGELVLETSSEESTVFCVSLPRAGA